MTIKEYIEQEGIGALINGDSGYFLYINRPDEIYLTIANNHPDQVLVAQSKPGREIGYIPADADLTTAMGMLIHLGMFTGETDCMEGSAKDQLDEI